MGIARSALRSSVSSAAAPTPVLKFPTMISDHAKFDYPDPLQPEDLQMIQRVFDVTCAAGGIRKKSPQAEGLAATLLELFQSGIRDEHKLEAAVAQIEFI
ncbi:MULTISPECIES: hypothetical protein [Neorhizobium]|uniref:hypothetical protein n=1 Tax=Neorhizobium sp. T6_25 TaxID=2093833 RepID=UPI00155E7EE3|nr:MULTISPECIES: hypothetical protein [Neorhizobium]